MESKIFSAILSSLDEIILYIRNELKNIDISLKERKNFELAIEEAVVNIMHYAYLDKVGTIEINCKIDEINHFFVVEIKDSGPPFNPLNENKIEFPKQLEMLTVGGLGIHFIKNLVDVANYCYHDKKNILTLSKKINFQKK